MLAAKPSSSPVALRVAIVLLTVVTAAIHFSLSFPDTVFILNALGYLALVAALYAPIPMLASRKPLVRWIFVGYTALTILLWVFIGLRIPIAYVAKADELALIALLMVERSRVGPEA